LKNLKHKNYHNRLTDFLFRPSGTEDIVRVYAECESSSDVNKLAVEVASLVYRLADGVGPEPSLS